jgi:hypothetical protein
VALSWHNLHRRLVFHLGRQLHPAVQLQYRLALTMFMLFWLLAAAVAAVVVLAAHRAAVAAELTFTAGLKLRQLAQLVQVVRAEQQLLTVQQAVQQFMAV